MSLAPERIGEEGEVGGGDRAAALGVGGGVGGWEWWWRGAVLESRPSICSLVSLGRNDHLIRVAEPVLHATDLGFLI